MNKLNVELGLRPQGCQPSTLNHNLKSQIKKVGNLKFNLKFNVTVKEQITAIPVFLYT